MTELVEVAPWRPYVRPAKLETTTLSVVVFAGACRVHGWSFDETTGAAPAKLRIRDGADVTGPRWVTITLLANESTRDFTDDAGLCFESGVFIEVVAGSVGGCVFVERL